jgi:lysophospholipase L1-like esterase
VVVLSMGANDATGLCTPMQWAQWQNRLAELIDDRFGPDLLVHSAVPPMHACKALPQPLRWFMGRWARQMNATLAGQLVDQHRRSLHWHPDSTTSVGMALDGLHPNPEGYSLWADGLSRHILSAQAQSAFRPGLRRA